MSPTDVPPASGPSDRGAAHADRSAKRNPWLWATIGVTRRVHGRPQDALRTEEQVDQLEADVDKANAGG